MKFKKIIFISLLMLSIDVYSQDFSINDLKKLEELQTQAEKSEQANGIQKPNTFADQPQQNNIEPGAAEIVNSKIFGHLFLNNKPNNISVTLDIPLQNNYQISFKDELQLLLVGSLTETYTLIVDLSGNILIPDIGKVSLAGLTLLEAQQKISNIISQKYVGVNSFLNISNAAYKKISVIGAVKEPGTYLVNPFSSIIEAVRYAGGLEKNASLREVKVVGNNGTEEIYDLYSFLIYGKYVGGSLKNGDTIILGATNNHFEFTGSVNRPMIYEYKESDTYSDLIDFALGATRMANLENITVSTGGPSGVTKDVVRTEKIGDLDVTKINIGSVISQDIFSVQIKGDSTNAGYKNYLRGTPLSKVISDLVFDANIYPFYATLEQVNPELLKKEFYSFSIADPVTYKDIKIEKNAVLNFISRSDIDNLSEDFQTFNELEVDERNDLISDSKDYVNSANQLEELYNNINRSERKIALQKIVNPFDLKILYISGQRYNVPIKGKISPEILFNFFGSNTKPEKDKTIVSLRESSVNNSYGQVFDASEIVSINIPNQVNNQIEVTIGGLVSAPGPYIVPVGTDLNILYAISGGFLNNASFDGIVVLRESVRLREEAAVAASKRIISDAAINSATNPINPSSNQFDFLQLITIAENIDFAGRVTGDFEPDSINTVNFILEDGDQIFVPSLTSSVTITGEVLNPITTYLSSETTVKSLIEFSGGLTKYADSSKIYIIKANGQSIPYREMLFSKEIFLDPGDTVVVPRDLGVMDTLPLVNVATKIISDIAFAAASLNTIRN